MKVGLNILYKSMSVEGKFFLNLVNKYLRFTPDTFIKQYNMYKWDERKHKKVLANSNKKDTLILSSSNNDVFKMSETGGVSIPIKSITIVQDLKVFLPSDFEVLDLINCPEFISGYIYHADYECIQSTQFSSTIKNRSFHDDIFSSIKGTPWKSDGLGGIEYDTRYNPGRSNLISGAWLMASWKMWFGKPFFEIVPKEKILSFPDAVEVKELENGIVYVQLFEKIEESATTDNMRIQQKWRDWLGYDELIATYK